LRGCGKARPPPCRNTPHSPWTFDQIQAYLKTALEAVGVNCSKVFDPAALDLLVRATTGVPRSVCLLARAAWLEAARADAQEINPQTLQQAMEQVPGLSGLTRPRS
jgi:type II secretory pathway predicted ATPase ExeA